MAFRTARSLSDLARPDVGRRRAPKAERHWVPTPGAAWGPVAQLTPNLRMQAAKGFRAAAVPLAPGLFLVSEVPEASAHAEFGLAPLLGPLMLMAAQRALNPMRAWTPAPSPEGPAPAAPTWAPALSQVVRPQPSPAAALGWAHPDDVARLGCSGCGGRCR